MIAVVALSATIVPDGNVISVTIRINIAFPSKNISAYNDQYDSKVDHQTFILKLSVCI